MRQALNSNPMVQALAIGVLAIIVAFLLLTRVMGQNEEPSPESATPTAATLSESSAAGAAPAAETGAAAEAAPAAESGAAAEATTTADPATAGSADDAAVSAAAAGKFVAGPGLPADVVKAYADGQVVVLLVVHPKGIEDREVESIVAGLRSRGDTTVFVVPAPKISDYSRITRGVNVDRTPALVVIQPRRLTEGGTPTASVSYGFRGPKSVNQAVEDALYDGRKDLPYYPE